MAKKEPLYPHIPKGRSGKETITLISEVSSVAETPDSFPYEEEEDIWRDVNKPPKYPIDYTEYQARLYKAGRDMGHITYYYLPSIKVGIVESASLFVPSTREDEQKVYRYAVQALLQIGAEFIYVAGKHLFPV